jgi:hypothetical protein
MDCDMAESNFTNNRASTSGSFIDDEAGLNGLVERTLVVDPKGPNTLDLADSAGPLTFHACIFVGASGTSGSLSSFAQVGGGSFYFKECCFQSFSSATYAHFRVTGGGVLTVSGCSANFNPTQAGGVSLDVAIVDACPPLDTIPPPTDSGSRTKEETDLESPTESPTKESTRGVNPYERHTRLFRFGLFLAWVRRG